MDHQNQIPDAFYYPITSPTYSSADRCTEITNAELRQQYPWIETSDHVEHIVDTSNGPTLLSSCNKNIRGNLIIAIGVWNMEIGNMCWNDVESEKRLVYGNDIVDFALESVRICCVVQLSSQSYVIFVIVIIAVTFIIFAVVKREKIISYIREHYDVATIFDKDCNENINSVADNENINTVADDENINTVVDNEQTSISTESEQGSDSNEDSDIKLDVYQ